jgi:hypothetical protein
MRKAISFQQSAFSELQKRLRPPKAKATVKKGVSRSVTSAGVKGEKS